MPTYLVALLLFFLWFTIRCCQFLEYTDKEHQLVNFFRYIMLSCYSVTYLIYLLMYNLLRRSR
jgi:hypothetical protein